MLKTDYKDAMYDGARKYRIIPNADGTSGISDETSYTQQGDQFGAKDINDTNAKVNRLGSVAEIALPVSAWSGEAPYTQTIQLEGVTAEDSLEIGILLTDDGDAASRKAKRKAWGFVDRAVTGEGTVTFYCYDKKPAADIVVLAKGVIG